MQMHAMEWGNSLQNSPAQFFLSTSFHAMATGVFVGFGGGVLAAYGVAKWNHNDHVKIYDRTCYIPAMTVFLLSVFTIGVLGPRLCK